MIIGQPFLRRNLPLTLIGRCNLGWIAFAKRWQPNDKRHLAELTDGPINSLPTPP